MLRFRKRPDLFSQFNIKYSHTHIPRLLERVYKHGNPGGLRFHVLAGQAFLIFLFGLYLNWQFCVETCIRLFCPLFLLVLPRLSPSVISSWFSRWSCLISVTTQTHRERMLISQVTTQERDSKVTFTFVTPPWEESSAVLITVTGDASPFLLPFKYGN